MNRMSNTTKKVTSTKDDKVISMKERKPSIDEIKKALDEQIVKFQNKAKLIRNRNKFVATRDQLVDFIKDQGTDYDPSLDSEQLKLVLSDNHRYSNDNYISIANNEVIRRILGILLVTVNEKIAEIEKLILE